MDAKGYLIIIVSAALAAVVSVLILKTFFDVESVAAIAGGVGGGVAGAIGGGLASRNLGDKKKG